MFSNAYRNPFCFPARISVTQRILFATALNLGQISYPIQLTILQTEYSRESTVWPVMGEEGSWRPLVV